MGFQLTFSLVTLGDIEEAEEVNQRGTVLFKEQGGPPVPIVIWLLGLGAGGSISRDEITWSHPIGDIAKDHLESPEEGLEELQRIIKMEII